MKNKKQIIELLKRYETILTTVKAPKSELKVLKELIEELEGVDNLSLPYSLNLFGSPQKTIKAIKKSSSYKSKLKDIASIYKKLNNNHLTDDSERELIESFEIKHPNIREFLFTDMEGLYNKVSHVGDRTWSVEELRLILLYHFSITPNQSTPKSDLVNMLKKNIYNYDYMNGMKKKYEGVN